jgi:hypothetical protein
MTAQDFDGPYSAREAHRRINGIGDRLEALEALGTKLSSTHYNVHDKLNERIDALEVKLNARDHVDVLHADSLKFVIDKFDIRIEELEHALHDNGIYADRAHGPLGAPPKTYPAKPVDRLVAAAQKAHGCVNAEGPKRQLYYALEFFRDVELAEPLEAKASYTPSGPDDGTRPRFLRDVDALVTAARDVKDYWYRDEYEVDSNEMSARVDVLIDAIGTFEEPKPKPISGAEFVDGMEESISKRNADVDSLVRAAVGMQCAAAEMLRAPHEESSRDWLSAASDVLKRCLKPFEPEWKP